MKCSIEKVTTRSFFFFEESQDKYISSNPLNRHSNQKGTSLVHSHTSTDGRHIPNDDKSSNLLHFLDWVFPKPTRISTRWNSSTIFITQNTENRQTVSPPEGKRNQKKKYSVFSTETQIKGWRSNLYTAFDKQLSKDSYKFSRAFPKMVTCNTPLKRFR